MEPEQFQLPEPLSLQGNIAENWRRWKQRFELYMVASEKNEKSNEVKAAIFLHLAGPEALEVFNTLSFDNDGDDKKLDKLIEKFQAFCIHITWERHVEANSLERQSTNTLQIYAIRQRHVSSGP